VENKSIKRMMITMFENENLETVIPSFEDLSFEEMKALQGDGEVPKQAETTPACGVAYLTGLAGGALVSATSC
jgi:type 2 lantibiotic (TIGR03893 family)